MLSEREFRIVRVRPESGIGLDRDGSDVTVCYKGQELRVSLPE